MSVDLSSEIWNELKRYINTVDRTEAAEVLVSVLVDNDVAPDEIRSRPPTRLNTTRSTAWMRSTHTTRSW